MVTRLKHLGVVSESLTGTAGTISVGRCREVEVQVILDGNASHEIAVRPTKSASGTVSKDSAAAVLADMGAVNFKIGNNDWYVAYKVYSGASVATGTSASDKIIVEKLG